MVARKPVLATKFNEGNEEKDPERPAYNLLK